MFKVSPASLQTFIDTPNRVLEDRVQYSTVHIPNAQKFFDHRQVHRDFLITLYVYLFLFILYTEFHVARKQTKFCCNWSHYTKGWAGVI